MAVGAPSVGNSQGAVYVLSGPFTKTAPKLLTSAYFSVSSSEVGGQIGVRIAVLDFDGDGDDDLLVGTTLASNPMAIFYGPLSSGAHVMNNADVRFGGGGDYRFGTGDLDADGKDDIVLRTTNTTLQLIRGRGR